MQRIMLEQKLIRVELRHDEGLFDDPTYRRLTRDGWRPDAIGGLDETEHWSVVLVRLTRARLQLAGADAA